MTTTAQDDSIREMARISTRRELATYLRKYRAEKAELLDTGSNHNWNYINKCGAIIAIYSAELDRRDGRTPAPQQGYAEVHSGAFGTGRRYRNQPGATQYDDGSGTYNVQIWDN